MVRVLVPSSCLSHHIVVCTLVHGQSGGTTYSSPLVVSRRKQHPFTFTDVIIIIYMYRMVPAHISYLYNENKKGNKRKKKREERDQWAKRECIDKQPTSMYGRDESAHFTHASSDEGRNGTQPSQAHPGPMFVLFAWLINHTFSANSTFSHSLSV